MGRSPLVGWLCWGASAGLRSAEAGPFYFPSKLRNTGQHQVPMGHGKRGTAAKDDFRLFGPFEHDIFLRAENVSGGGLGDFFAWSERQIRIDCRLTVSKRQWEVRMRRPQRAQGHAEELGSQTLKTESGVRYESVRPPAECPAACLRALRGRPHQAHIARSRCGARRASESTGAAGSSSQFASRDVRCGASALPPSPATVVASKW